MARRVLILFVFLLLAATSGCEPTRDARIVGSGTIVSEKPAVDAFEKVELIGGFHVDMSVAPTHSVSIMTDDNIMPLIETGVTDAELTIRLPVRVKPSDSNRVTITTPSLAEFRCKGAADASVRDVGGDSFAVVVKGAASVTTSGKVNSLSITVEGAGRVDAFELEGKSVAVTVDGAGSVDTHAVDKLDVTLRGFGAVRYRGDPEVTKSVAGLGTVVRE
ncbi:MAG: head GIN domain-containing protein [Phycisphaerae bacterium]